MPRRSRVHTAGLIFHVLNRGAKKASLFESDGDYTAFLRLLDMATRRERVAVLAYCLMPNHWHLLLMPQAEGALSRCLHWLTTTHARRWQLARGTEGQGAVYQARFKALAVKDDGHFRWVCRYIERNAMRASLVGRAEDWRWSSLWQRRARDPRVDLARWPIPEPDDWCDQVNIPQTAAELERFRCAVVSGTPFGDEAWRRRVEHALGRGYRRPRGRPRRDCPRKMTPDPLTNLCS
jgi:putative transposase